MSNIKCGNCRGYHDSVEDVRNCCDAPEAFLGVTTSSKRQPTQKQLDFAHSLLRVRQPYGLVADAEATGGINAAHEFVNGMDSNTIGEFLTSMKTQPFRDGVASTRSRTVHVTEGLFRMNGSVYKVQRAVHGSGHLYAKVLNGNRFERAVGALSALREEHRMTLAEAQEYGRLYGVCCRCGRTLTDESSIEAGIGPICARKEGWA